MEESLLTRYLNSRPSFIRGFDYDYMKSNRSKQLNNSKKIYGGNMTNIPKSQFIKLLETYHGECCGEIVNEIYQYLHDKFNNICGYNMNPMEINIDEITDLILDLTKQKMNLGDSIPKNRTYNIVHKDGMNDEIFNDISLDLLEEDENIKVDMETTMKLDNDVDINTMTVEDVYEQYVVYNGPKYALYMRYIDKLLNKMETDIDEELIKTIKNKLNKPE